MECEKLEGNFLQYVRSLSEDNKLFLPLKTASELEETIEYIKERIKLAASLHTNKRYRSCLIHYDHYRSCLSNTTYGIGKNPIIDYFTNLGFQVKENYQGITISW
jgi:hypothetical protein